MIVATSKAAVSLSSFRGSFSKSEFPAGRGNMIVTIKTLQQKSFKIEIEETETVSTL